MGIFDIFRSKNAAATKPATTEIKSSRALKDKTVKQQLYRFNNELRNWKGAINDFEDVYHPTNEALIGVYNDVVIDSHLSACIDNRISRTTSKDFKVVDEKGVKKEEESAIFAAAWFRDFLKYSLESKFYGYSLVQFGDLVNKRFSFVEVFPREYVYPAANSVRKYANSNTELIPYDGPDFAPWVLGVGKNQDLGLLMKAAPLVIYKKTALGSWTEFAEIFGAPFRMGKTDVRDVELRDNMFNMLENMGRNAYGVFDKDDIIEFVRDGKTDSHNVFNELVERVNSELSKLILGSTMVMDDGSSKAQGQVHERTSAAINKEDAFFVLSVVNDQLIPFLNKYHGFNIVGKFVFDDTENTSKQEQFKIDIELVKNGFNVPKEYFTDTYGTPIEDKEEEPEPNGPKGSKEEEDNGDSAESLIKKKTTIANISSSFFTDGFNECCNALDYEEAPVPVWSDEYIDEIISGVHSGLYTLENLPESLYLELGKRLEGALYEGIGSNVSLNTIENPTYINTLRNNIFTFSGAKTWQQINEMSAFLVDENGDTRTFKEYKDFAKKTFGEYNVNYLRTELNHVKGSGQMADKWKQFDDEAEIFPYLRYVTAGDERVRSSHKALNGVIKPVNSPFWTANAPLNGWNCRCNLVQVEEAIETPDADIKVPTDTPDYMKNNPGREIFGKEHPYFKVPKGFKKDQLDNFGLPKPKPVPKEKLVKILKKEAEKPIEISSFAERAKSLGVKVYREESFNKDFNSAILSALERVPEKAVPEIIGNFKDSSEMIATKYSAAQKNNFGAKIDFFDFKIKKSELTEELKKAPHLISQNSDSVTVSKGGKGVFYNSAKYKNIKNITARKKEIAPLWEAKGERYWIKSALENDDFTIYHELGHVFDDNTRVFNNVKIQTELEKWYKESKIIHLKKNIKSFGADSYSEAFADAFADYYTTGGENLPISLLTELKTLLTK